MPATKSETSILTKLANDAAVKFLKGRGYEILERNWVGLAGQHIDIIAKDDDTVVLTDVMVRDDSVKGFPEEPNFKIERKRYEGVALAYLASHDFGNCRVRFDNIALVVLGDRALVRHHVNALTV